jgi:cyclophilin family peptidyl-prolyl cis-trans isomerase
MIWHRKPAKISLITWMLLVLLTQVFFRIVTLGNQTNSDHKIQVVQGGLNFDVDKGYQADTVLASIEHEPTAQTGIKHRDGTISMGRFAPGETCGSFFFCIGDQPELDHGGHGLPLSARWSRAGMFCSAYSNVAKKQNFYAKK